MDNVYTVVITALTVLGGTSAWRYYEKRAMNKEKHEEFARVDCRERISKLEALLEESAVVNAFEIVPLEILEALILVSEAPLPEMLAFIVPVTVTLLAKVAF
jgi:hypothetical protein